MFRSWSWTRKRTQRGRAGIDLDVPYALWAAASPEQRVSTDLFCGGTPPDFRLVSSAFSRGCGGYARLEEGLGNVASSV